MKAVPRILIVVSLLVLACAACSAHAGCGDPANCTRVLFVGNSYTYVNDLPDTFAALAASGGHPVEVGMAAQGGWTLARHAASADSLQQIDAQKWTYVVLQEQSEIPSVPQSELQSMYPAARTLVQKIRADGAIPLFYLTMAHRDGWPESGMPDYASMQARLEAGTLQVAQNLQAGVVPVGAAWALLHGQDPRLDLWQSDGSHPTVQGTYLAACVFYAAIFQSSPVGLSYGDGLSGGQARLLQQAAADAVLADPGSWGLPAAR